MDRLFTVVYAFMSTALGLKGLAKEVFAIIFGFWMDSNKTEAWVSLRTMQKLTGRTRSAIIDAVQLLESLRYIQIFRDPGKQSLYIVTIDPKIVQDFEVTFGKVSAKLQCRRPVQKPKQYQDKNFTSSSLDSLPVIKTKGKSNNSLRVKANNEIDYGGLPEA